MHTDTALCLDGMGLHSEPLTGVMNDIRGAVGVWSHLGVFPERYRECLSKYFGMAPDLERYVKAWQRCGLPLRDTLGYDMAYSPLARRLAISTEVRRTGALQDMLSADMLPSDHHVTGLSMAAAGVTAEALLVVGLPTLDEVIAELPVDVVEKENDIVCEGAIAQVNSSDEGVISHEGSAISECSDEVVEHEVCVGVGGAIGAPEVVAENKVVSPAAQGFIDDIEEGVNSCSIGSGDDIGSGYVSLLKPGYRDRAKEVFGSRVSYAALLAMPMIWFDEGFIAAVAEGFPGKHSVIADYVLAVVADSERTGWVCPDGSLGKELEREGRFPLGGVAPGLDDEVFKGAVGGGHVMPGDGKQYQKGYCYREWEAEYPKLAAMGPWPTTRGLREAGVSSCGSASLHFLHADDHGKMLSGEGVVGGKVVPLEHGDYAPGMPFDVGSILGVKDARMKVTQFLFLSSGTDGKKLGLEIRIAEAPGWDIQVALGPDVKYHCISRGGVGTGSFATFKYYADDWLKSEGSCIPLVLVIKDGKITDVEAGDMRP